MELLGRDPQLAAATRAIGDVRRGSGRVLGLLGEAGLGKSAMLAEIARARTRRRACGSSRAAAIEHERDVPFGVMCDALGELAGRARAAIPVAERFRRHRAVRRRRWSAWRPSRCCSTTCTGPTRPRVELVLHLLRRPPCRAGAAGARRRARSARAGRLLDAARSARGLGAARARAARAATTRYALLAGVADAAVRERVVLEGRGNPLFLRELARVADRADGALPASLVAAIGARGRGPGRRAARALLEGAAVAGDPFDPELAAAAAELDEPIALAALDGVVAADLVRPAAARPASGLTEPSAARAPARASGARRSSSATRSSGARSTTAPRPRGGWARTSAPRPRSPGAAPGPPRAPSTWCARRTSGDLDGGRGAAAAAAEAAGESSPAAAAHWFAAALRLVPDAEHATRAGLLAREARRAGRRRAARARRARRCWKRSRSPPQRSSS